MTAADDAFAAAERLIAEAIDKFNEKVTESVEVTMRILHVKDQNKCCVEFTRVSGRLSTFLAHFESYKTDVLKFADDAV